MTTITVPAACDQLDTVQHFVGEVLAQVPHSPEAQMQIQIAVEELFVNIASYAYAPKSGQAVIACQTEQSPPRFIVQFRDWGKPFDPLAKKDADITLSAEERGIGGLGIFMVKDYMDEMSYSYENGQNILTIQKNL